MVSSHRSSYEWSWFGIVAPWSLVLHVFGYGPSAFLGACTLALLEIDVVRGFVCASTLRVRRGRGCVPDSSDAEQITAPVIEAAREIDHLHLRQGPGQIVGSTGTIEQRSDSSFEAVLLERVQ